MATPAARPQSYGVETTSGLSSQPWFKSSQRILGRDWPTAYLFILPTALLLFGLIGYPFARAVYLSFHNAVGPRLGVFVGFDNYLTLWKDDFFLRAVSVTVAFTVWSVAIKFVLGLSTALLLHHVPRWGSVLGGLILLPYIIPEVVRALAWRVLLDPLFGALNFILVNVLGVMSQGLPWLGNPSTALPSVILVNIWAGTPFFIILLVAGLKAIDTELYDAAAVDGASAWRKFLHITLPGLRYVIIVASLLSTIFTFNGFTLTYLLTGGGPGGATRIYTILAYEYAVQGLRYGAGIAVAMTTAPALFLLILFLGRYMMNRGDESRAESDDSATWRIAMTVLWPVRMLLRGVLAVFWVVNDAVERVISAAAAAVRPAGGASLLPRAASRRLGHGVMYALLGAVLAFELLPFYFIVVTAFKSTLQIQQIQSMFWPNPWVLDHFRYLFTQIPFVNWYANTVMVSAASTAVSVLAASLGAYGLVRLKWRGSGVLGTTVLISYLMPAALMFIPLYTILAALGLLNKQLALIVTYPTVVLPFATWLMMGYYRSIPEELEDAAMIDGCTRFGAFWRVVLPLVRPALLAVTMFSVTQAWNEFLYAYMFLRSSEVFTLPVGLAQLIVGDVQPWGVLMAASLLTAGPVVVIYMLGQRFMVAGLTAGSVKG
ncbi:MAG: ABC transporter permease subunit [Chloroflexi bacterium]|nr:ABC transporter permease subunit [Chloroflexota bacterium]